MDRDIIKQSLEILDESINNIKIKQINIVSDELLKIIKKYNTKKYNTKKYNTNKKIKSEKSEKNNNIDIKQIITSQSVTSVSSSVLLEKSSDLKVSVLTVGSVFNNSYNDSQNIETSKTDSACNYALFKKDDNKIIKSTDQIDIF
jgi:hypothetical protein